MDKETQLFTFLEKEKDKLYKLENKNKQPKLTETQLNLIKKIYKIFNFKFSKIAYIQKKEEKLWNQYFDIVKQSPKFEKVIFKSLNTLNETKHIYNRLKKYDILKIGNQSYVIK